MREYTHTHVYYTKDDCDALDRMPLSEVVAILERLEGTWMPGRPNEYYQLSAGRVDEAEFDFDLLKAHKAIDIAASRLRAVLAKEEAASG